MNAINILNVLKSCDGYIDMLIENKKTSDWEKAIQHMKENKELENSLKKRMIKENDIDNINFIVNSLWFDYKKSSVKLQTCNKITNSGGGMISRNINMNMNINININMTSNTNYSNNINSNIHNISVEYIEYSLKLLIEIFEIFYTKNEFTTEIVIKSNKHFRNLIILIFLKYLKIFQNNGKNFEGFIKFREFIWKYKSYVNITSIIEKLKAEGLVYYANELSKENTVIDNSGLNLQQVTTSFYSYLDKIESRVKIPTHWRMTESYNII
jgi:hypothetical protein